jgi:hypothetical protein
MMTTVLPDDYKISIRVIAYKEDRDNWRQWKIKTRAIGMKKKWVKARDADYCTLGKESQLFWLTISYSKRKMTMLEIIW